MIKEELIERLEGYKISSMSNHEIRYQVCPFCQSKDNSFSVNIEKELYICHRGSCSATGNFEKLSEYFGLEKENSILEYKKEEYGDIQQSLKWLTKNKISIETISKFKAKFNAVHNSIDFFVIDGKKIKAIKRRFIEPKTIKELSVKGSNVSYLFNYENCDSDILYVTEGCKDLLALAQVGVEINKLCSITGGVHNLNWLDTHKEFLSDKEIVILFDNDEAGRKTLDKIIENEKYNCFDLKMINYSKMGKSKDIHDYYIENSLGALDLISDVQPMQTRQVANIEDIKEHELTELPKFSLERINYMLNGHRGRELTIHCGKTSNSKTTFILNYLADMMSKNQKVFMFNGENKADKVKFDIYKCLSNDEDIINLDKIDFRGKKEVKLKDEKIRELEKNYGKKLRILTKEKIQGKELIKIINRELMVHDIRIFFLDNLMCIDVSDYDKNELNAIDMFFSELQHLAKNKNIHIHIVAHPNKEGQMTEIEKVDATHIYGSSKIANLVNNIIWYEIKSCEVGGGEVLLNCARLLKNRECGHDTRTKNKMEWFIYQLRNGRMHDLINTPTKKKDVYEINDISFKKVVFEQEVKKEIKKGDFKWL